MQENELKALISLLDDSDPEVYEHVTAKLLELGPKVVPALENEWEYMGLSNPTLQKQIEDLIHTIQFNTLKNRLLQWKESSNRDLLEGIWIINTLQNPELELHYIKNQIEQIFYEVWIEFRNELHPYDQIKILNAVFFDKLGFGPATKNIHAVSNSMLSQVLETKKGNPIMLCSIYMIVAQKLKMPFFGVKLPNLFVLIYKTEITQFYVNVFNRGVVIHKLDIDNFLEQLKIAPIDSYYEPCPTIEFLKRMLRNIAFSFEKAGDYERIHEIQILMNILNEQ